MRRCRAPFDETAGMRGESLGDDRGAVDSVTADLATGSNQHMVLADCASGDEPGDAYIARLKHQYRAR